MILLILCAIWGEHFFFFRGGVVFKYVFLNNETGWFEDVCNFF